MLEKEAPLELMVKVCICLALTIHCFSIVVCIRFRGFRKSCLLSNARPGLATPGTCRASSRPEQGMSLLRIQYFLINMDGKKVQDIKDVLTLWCLRFFKPLNWAVVWEFLNSRNSLAFNLTYCLVSHWMLGFDRFKANAFKPRRSTFYVIYSYIVIPHSYSVLFTEIICRLIAWMSLSCQSTWHLRLKDVKIEAKALSWHVSPLSRAPPALSDASPNPRRHLQWQIFRCRKRLRGMRSI